MRKIYTRTGDKGMTGIHGGERVPKDDIRIEANGCIDELNTVIGIVRSLLPVDDVWQGLLHDIQRELMVVMSHVATPSALRDADPERPGSGNPNPLHAAEMTVQCEQARAVARRAERRLWTLNREDSVPEDILRFINRLSDLFFVMARMEMQRQGWDEERWQAFAYKRKRKQP